MSSITLLWNKTISGECVNVFRCARFQPNKTKLEVIAENVFMV